MPDTIPVFDGHNDTLMRFSLPGRHPKTTFFERGDEGHIDLPRALEGGLAGGMFAVFVPPRRTRKKPPPFTSYLTDDGYAAPLSPAIKQDYALQTAMKMTARLFTLAAESDGRFRVARTADEIERGLRDGVLTAVLHFEGAEPIDPDLDALEVFYQAGLRSLGLVWSRPNIFAEGVPFQFPHTPDTGPGLTDAGRALVRACNQLGILIDLSHINERGFWDVAALSDAPLVATHSNAHAITPLTRNLTDKQLDAVRETDGMVGLNFGVPFLREDGGNDVDTPLSVMLRHVDYLVERVGIDRVGFGSDFDGTSIPAELKDAAGLPRLIDALRQAGYDEAALRKIAHENWLRVLRQTWKPAQQAGQASRLPPQNSE